MKTTEYANSLFEQPWWLDIVAPGKWKELFVFDKNGEIIARQAIAFDGNRVYMPKMTQTMGIWMSKNVNGDYGAQKRILQDLKEQMKVFRYIHFSLAPENQYVLPYLWFQYSIEPRFTYRINDLTNLEKLYEGLNKTAKKNIKAAKNKVSISYEINFTELWEMLNATFKAQNRKNPMSKQLVYDIVTMCEREQSGKYICAKDKEGNIHSCAYFVYDENVCYYLLGASDVKYRASGAQSLVLWEGIRFASEHSKVFDFEGSMIEGIENFFRQFNCENTVYYDVYKRSLLSEFLHIVKPRIKRLIGYRL